MSAEDELFSRLELEFAGLDEPALTTGLGSGAGLGNGPGNGLSPDVNNAFGSELGTGWSTYPSPYPSVYPGRQLGRHRLAVTLRLFLGRATYFLFLTAYLSLLFAGHSALQVRAIPILLLALPAAFVVGFVRRLGPALRLSLRQLLRRRAIAVAVELQLVTVLLILIGVLSPQPSRPILAGVATALVLAARLVLYLDTRRLLRADPFPDSRD